MRHILIKYFFKNLFKAIHKTRFPPQNKLAGKNKAKVRKKRKQKESKEKRDSEAKLIIYLTLVRPSESHQPRDPFSLLLAVSPAPSEGPFSFLTALWKRVPLHCSRRLLLPSALCLRWHWPVPIPALLAPSCSMLWVSAHCGSPLRLTPAVPCLWKLPGWWSQAMVYLNILKIDWFFSPSYTPILSSPFRLSFGDLISRPGCGFAFAKYVVISSEMTLETQQSSDPNLLHPGKREAASLPSAFPHLGLLLCVFTHLLIPLPFPHNSYLWVLPGFEIHITPDMLRC